MDTQFINANGLKLAYEEFGQRDNPTVLLIMGMGMQMLGWPGEFCKQIADQGYHVIRFDNRDTGLSEKLNLSREPNLMVTLLRSRLNLPVSVPYSLEDMAQDALALLTALEVDRAHIVGASMGGMIAQILTAYHPRRVASLTSIMSTSGAPYLPGTHWRIMLHLSKRPKSDRESILRHTVRSHQLIGSPGYPQSKAALRRKAQESYERSYFPMGMQRHALAITASGDRSRLLTSISRPTLVIHGKQDPMIHYAAGLDTVRKIRQSKLELIDGMGHNLPPQLFQRLSDSMTEHFTSHQ